MMRPTADTRAAVVTAGGRGAIAVVRVWGPGADAAIERTFRPSARRQSARLSLNRPRVGRMGAGAGDEVVVVRESPESIEVQCHGGVAAVRLILDALGEGGVEIVDPRDCVAADEPTPLCRQAAQLLARTTTLRAAEILLEQASGALDLALAEVLNLLANPSPAARAAVGRLLVALIGR
jgi:tRNA modification GTPase